MMCWCGYPENIRHLLHYYHVIYHTFSLTQGYIENCPYSAIGSGYLVVNHVICGLLRFPAINAVWTIEDMYYALEEGPEVWYGVVLFAYNYLAMRLGGDIDASIEHAKVATVLV
jgi:hypothetical protein